MDDCVGVGDEDGAVDQKRLSKREVVVNKIVDPICLLTPTTIKYESPLQESVNAGLERSKPLQDELDKEAGAVRQEMKLKKGGSKHHQTGGLPKD